jgi:rod shape-determining protein MreC
MLQTRSERQARATRRWVVIYAMLLAICLTGIAFSNAGPIQEFRRGLVFAVSPIQEALSGTTRTITSLAGAIGDVDQLRRDNQAFSDRVTSLETQIQQLTTLKTENQRLADLLKVQAALQFQTVAADVVARQATDQERVLTITRGGDGSIAVGDPVLSEGGALVGVITEVGPNWSTVMLMSDPRSVVIGLDEQSKDRATGEIVGRLDALLAMSNVPSNVQLSTDDVIVTAGTEIGDESAPPFPRGILVGRIVQVVNDPSAVIQTGLIQPTADLDSIERVLVVTNFEPPPNPHPSASPHH